MIDSHEWPVCEQVARRLVLNQFCSVLGGDCININTLLLITMDDSSTFSCWGSANEDIIKSQYPLHRACRDGDVETLSLLLMEGQHGVYVEDSFYGWTPAHWAAHFGKVCDMLF